MIYIMVIGTNFKLENAIKLFFIKKKIDEISFFFFAKEHVRTLISKKIKNIIHFPLLKANPH